MQFIGLDEAFYEKRMQHKIPFEKKFKRQRLALGFAVASMIAGMILYFFVPITKGNVIVITFVSSAILRIACLSLGLYTSYKEMKPFWNLMKLYNQPDQITVFPDFHMEIKSYTGNYIDMSNVRAFHKNTVHDSLTVEYSYGNQGGNCPLTYEISYGMKDLATIETLLRFKIKLQKSEKFANDSMKKIFQMEPSLRNRLFVDELNSGDLLMPIRLVEKSEYNEHCMLLFNDIYVKYEIDDQGYLCMYTSRQEMSKQTLQEYPQSVHVSVKHVYSLLTQNYSSIFNESNADFFITINRHNEKVNLSRVQLSKMLLIHEQDKVSQLYRA
ncbi:MAG: hypothetical protein RR441_10200 [Longicatena sp.]